MDSGKKRPTLTKKKKKGKHATNQQLFQPYGKLSWLQQKEQKQQWGKKTRNETSQPSELARSNKTTQQQQRGEKKRVETYNVGSGNNFIMAHKFAIQI